MTDDHHRRMNAARTHLRLTVQDLWLRYVALGGSNDAFDLDGYLQGLMPLDSFQESVLAQAVNEALTDSYDSYLIPLPESDTPDDRRLRELIVELLDEPPPRAGNP